MNVKYKMINSLSGNERRRYSGPTGWVLAYHEDDSGWRITSPINPNISIFLNDQDLLPLGKKTWTPPASKCNKGMNE